ncbi:biotin carboxylase N-terminal domain-containing protein [Shimia ponticola]|uniref:ATP-binding protein n=1 Tax=Shimia ponticola TaxID=2582893 RepID=UPI0011BE0794|nr:biotin carboxylase N-terminal domain-containing protein [Shimia ponticola]
MIDTLLIANRGEIACRIARTARAMGLRTVAVYSDADAGAAHVAACDLAYPIGGAAPADSYLRGDRIIAAAQAAGAQAIHPGYGFLSENPDFVEAVEAAGLIFVGPSAKAIRAMGLKDAAKALMEEAGVPVVPGYHGADQSDALLGAEAQRIGYPVLIKAVAGGGGKGMRRVDNPSDFADALRAARAEARTAFGNDDVLVEKYVGTPRHVEVQVFGDGTKAVHLYERDCSLQRRHQKVIEEAPAPGMTPEMRDAMGQAAVRAAEAIGYSGAGTVEFIVDATDGLRPDRFYFMEMNTRLQVEHPVTEAITGVDLVAWQLRVARGEPLPMAQNDIPLRGHAMEARLYAEDAAAGFLPAIGRLTRFDAPEAARLDTGVRAGDEITPHYDPMIAKLIVHGDTRDEALSRLDRALSDTRISGVTTNLGFLRRLARTNGYQTGKVDTGLIDREGEALAADAIPCSKTRALAAIAALGLDQSPPAHAGFALWHSQAQIARLAWSGDAIDIRVTTRGADVFDVHGDDWHHEVTRLGATWRIDGVQTSACLQADVGRVTVFDGAPYVFDVADPLARGGASAGGNVIEAPMPGLVQTISAKPGQSVQEGDALATLEAMKMEHVLRAPRAGTVADVLVAAGAQVAAGAALITLEDDA